jgi:hypothetical protein
MEIFTMTPTTLSSPARTVIAKLGGPKVVARLLGLHASSVYRWTYPKALGGGAGIVPSRHQARLMLLAKAQGIPLWPSDFFNDEEVEACVPSPSVAAAGPPVRRLGGPRATR